MQQIFQKNIWPSNYFCRDPYLDCANPANTPSLISLTKQKLKVSHGLPRSKVTNQVAFDQRDLHLTPEFERTYKSYPTYMACVSGYHFSA